MVAATKSRKEKVMSTSGLLIPKTARIPVATTTKANGGRKLRFKFAQEARRHAIKGQIPVIRSKIKPKGIITWL